MLLRGLAHALEFVEHRMPETHYMLGRADVPHFSNMVLIGDVWFKGAVMYVCLHLCTYVFM